MKQILIMLCLFSFSLTYSIGFDGNTLVTMSSGRTKPISEIKINDEVICYNKNIQRESSIVKGICTFTVETTIEITTQDDISVFVSNIEQFFLPKEGAWVFTKDLKIGDCLLNDDLEAITIVKIDYHNEPREMFAITVDKLHNFLASEGKYLVHNGPLAAWQAYWATKVALYGALGVAVTGTVITTGGAVVATASAYAAGTATIGTIVTGVGAGLTGATVGTVAVGSTTAGLAVGTVATVSTIVGGVEVGAAATAYATGVSAMVTVSSASATAGGAAGICASTAAAIEVACVAAFTAALTCPFTPW